MKCPSYEGDVYGCINAFVIGCCPPQVSGAGCSMGWIKTWTPAERAGLKAMGCALRTFIPMSEYPTLEDGLRAHRGIIRAYVRAAREEKEKK